MQVINSTKHSTWSAIVTCQQLLYVYRCHAAKLICYVLVCSHTQQSPVVLFALQALSKLKSRSSLNLECIMHGAHTYMSATNCKVLLHLSRKHSTARVPMYFSSKSYMSAWHGMVLQRSMLVKSATTSPLLQYCTCNTSASTNTPLTPCMHAPLMQLHNNQYKNSRMYCYVCVAQHRSLQ